MGKARTFNQNSKKKEDKTIIIIQGVYGTLLTVEISMS